MTTSKINPIVRGARLPSDASVLSGVIGFRIVKRNRRGVTTVEMAIVASILFLFIFGGFEVTRLISLKNSAEYSAYLGARVGIISGASADAVKNQTLDHLDALGVRDASVEVIPEVIREDTEMVRVVVSIPLSSNSWGAPQFFGTDLEGRSSLLTERASVSATQVNQTSSGNTDSSSANSSTSNSSTSSSSTSSSTSSSRTRAPRETETRTRAPRETESRAPRETDSRTRAPRGSSTTATSSSSSTSSSSTSSSSSGGTSAESLQALKDLR